jgi:hypothetical protein
MYGCRSSDGANIGVIRIGMGYEMLRNNVMICCLLDMAAMTG